MHDETIDELIEVKATTDRPMIRLALGQILDYRRYVGATSSALLVPTAPADDLIELLHAHEIRVIWPITDGKGGFAASREHKTAGCDDRAPICSAEPIAALLSDTL